MNEFLSVLMLDTWNRGKSVELFIAIILENIMSADVQSSNN